MKISILKKVYERPEMQMEIISVCSALCVVSADGAAIGDASFEEYGEI